MPRPTEWPASLGASLLLHALIGLYLGNVLRVTLMLQSLDLPPERAATPLTSLGFAITAAAAIGGVLLLANLIAGRAVGWRQRWFYLVPPLLAMALIVAGGVIGTVVYLRG